MVGKNVLANFQAYKSGHELNNLALQQMLLPQNSEIVTFKDKKEIDNVFKYDLSTFSTTKLNDVNNMVF